MGLEDSTYPETLDLDSRLPALASFCRLNLISGVRAGLFLATRRDQ
jgi:hypothetical protein